MTITDAQLKRVNDVLIRSSNEISNIIHEPVILNIQFTSGIVTEAIIISKIEEAFAIMWDDVIQKSGKQKYVFPRQVYCYLIKKFIPKKILREIGTEIGNKHHTTVLHYIKNVEDLMDTQDALIAPKVHSIISELICFK